MAKQSAPVSLTGGKGFNFEDYVAARFLLDMLAGIAPFGTHFGEVTRIDWQARDAGRLLDDLVVTLQAENAAGTAEIPLSETGK